MSAKQLIIGVTSAAVMLSSLMPCSALRAAVQPVETSIVRKSVVTMRWSPSDGEPLFLPLSRSVDAHQLLAFQEYPSMIDAKYDQQDRAYHCRYDNNKKKEDDSAALDFYIVGDVIQTGTITCPKTDRYPAFETS